MIQPHAPQSRWQTILLATVLLASTLSAATPVELDLGSGTRLRFTTPAPELQDGAALPEPEFDANGEATVSGLHLKRTLVRDGAGYRLTLAVTNRRETPIELKSLTPLRTEDAKDVTVAGTGVGAWTVFRIARHKNDIPGPFRPTLVNDASRDAAIDNSGPTPIDDPQEAGAHGPTFHGDPGMVLIADDRPATSALFIGFAGQSRHLNDVSLDLDAGRTALEHLVARAEFDGVIVPPGGTRETHPLYLATGKDCDGLLADHVERIRQLYGARHAPWKNLYCSWYFYGPEITADDLRADLAELRQRPLALDSFLIDYGWSRFGEWKADPQRFPAGMKAMADEIKAAGLVPGIWTAPFILAPDHPEIQANPLWALHNRSGKKIEFGIAGLGMGRFVLDPTAPGAREYLLGLCRQLRGWGYGYLKFDFLRAIVSYPDAVYYDRTMNRAQVYRLAMETLREGAGPDAVIGVWGGLYEANAGLVDINRSGSDVRGHWDPINEYPYGTRYAVRMRQTFGRTFYDPLWTSDQDAIMIRRRTTQWRTTRPHISMGVFTDDEAFSTVVYRFLGGGMVMIADKLNDVPADRYALYRHAIPTYAPAAQPFKPWSDYLPEYFVTHFKARNGLPPWAVVSLCNWNGKEPKTLSFRPSEISGLPAAPAYAVFDFQRQEFLGAFAPGDTIALDTPTHGTRVLRLTPVPADGRYLIGTDLNLSNGMEIESIAGAVVVPRAEVADLPIRFTFLRWTGGQGVVETVTHRAGAAQ